MNASLVVVTKRIVTGEWPPRPLEEKRLGLLDRFWGIVRTSLAHVIEERPSISTFVDFLEKATPDNVATMRLHTLMSYGTLT